MYLDRRFNIASYRSSASSSASYGSSFSSPTGRKSEGIRNKFMFVGIVLSKNSDEFLIDLQSATFKQVIIFQ